MTLKIFTDVALRHCPCGKPLIRRPQEALSSFENRKYCCQSCRNIYRYADVVKVKNCRICGKEFTRRPDEDAGNFNKRKACDDPKCKSEMRQRIGYQNSKKNPKPTQTYLPIPAPLPRDETDYLIRRVETPLAEGIRLYSLRQAAWLFVKPILPFSG